MAKSEQRTDPFSAGDEAFFREGRELTSERPVTLAAEEPLAEPAPRTAAVEARRARFVRPVIRICAVLCLVATAGALRHALRAAPTALVTSAPESAAATAEPPRDEPEVASELVAATEERPDLLMTSTCDGADPAPAPLPDASEAGPIGPPLPPGTILPERSGGKIAVHAKAKPVARGPSRHGVAPARRQGRAVPMTKSALLSAIRAS
jgi:hypothetical protein